MNELEAYVAFAPVLTNEAINRNDGRTLYARDAFKAIKPEIPVVIDHDMDQQIGIVRGTGVLKDVDGYLWHVAFCDISEDPPSWLQRGTGASVSYRPFGESTRWGYHAVRQAILDEITVTSPAFKPANPDARVLILKRSESKPTTSRAPGRSPAVPELLVPIEARHSMDAAPHRLIRRPGIGQVLGVR